MSIIEKLKDSTKGLGEKPAELLQDSGKAISESVGNATKDLKNSLDEFSQKGIVGASKDFMETNGFLAKFVFIILVLIVFMVLLNLGMQIVGFFMKTSTNPLLVKGKLDGQELTSIAQDPANPTGQVILRSNNKQTGAEYTWSTWLYLKANQTQNKTQRSKIFVKGEGLQTGTNPSGYLISNSPGVYCYTDTSGTTGGFTSVEMLLDCVDSTTQKINIGNMPHDKWVHLAIRLQNQMVDVYVNGVVSVRTELLSLPKQNYQDVNIGGFKGSISNLQYYSYALNVFEINNIVVRGPNLSSSVLSSDAQNQSGNSSYLSNIWYKRAAN